MSTRTTLVLSGLGALVVCLAVGYAWGASGRRTAEIALDDARQQMDLAQARGEPPFLKACCAFGSVFG